MLVETLTRGILDLGHAFIASAFAEENSGGRGMGKNMAPDRLAAIGPCKQCTSTRVTLDLVCLE